MTSENGVVATMPMAPAGYSGGGFGSGFGWGNDIWLIIIILFAFGGFGFGGGGYGNGANNTASVLYPWMNSSQQVSDGFRDQMINSNITGIQTSLTNGFSGVQNALCSGVAGVNGAIANGFAQSEISANARQMADMQQNFALSQQLSQCCCDNKTATQSLAYNIATEACADRNAISSALRDVLEANNASTQKILDTMCQDKIDAKNERIAELQNQLTMANLAASQNLQTQQILAGQERGVNAVEQYLAPTPRPAYIVQNPNCCAPQFACGCAA